MLSRVTLSSRTGSDLSVLPYGNWRSLATYRARIALKLKKIAFQETMIDLPSGEHFSEAFNITN